MHAFLRTDSNIIALERKYIDVSVASIANSNSSAVNNRAGSAPPVQELGVRLLELAKKGDAEGVRDLMSRGAPFSTDWLGTSPLHFAAQFNHVETVEMLLKAGISRDARNKVERTPLHVASQEGHIDILKLLIDHGSDVDCKDMLRMTPLHWAAQNGHAKCVRILLDFGADPLVENKFDKSPETIALENERADIVEMLQDAAALDPISRKVLKERDVGPVMNCKGALDNLSSQGQMQIQEDFQQPDDAVADPSGTLLKIHKIVGRRKTQTAPRNVKFSDLSELPPTPPVEDLTNDSDNDNTEQDLIEIASRHHHQTTHATDLNRRTPSTTLHHRVNSPNLSATSASSATGTNTTNSTLQMLQAHGITMLPVDDSSIVESAVQSGQTVILTEAGKLALNLTKVKPTTNGTTNSSLTGTNGSNKLFANNHIGAIKRIPLANKQQQGTVVTPTKILPQGKKVITIKADELINMTREKKVIIHTGDKKLGRPAQIICSKPLELATKLGNYTMVNNKFVQINPLNRPIKRLKVENEEEDKNDLESVRRQLEDAKRQIKMYREQLVLKEKEAEQYRLRIERLERSKVTKSYQLG